MVGPRDNADFVAFVDPVSGTRLNHMHEQRLDAIRQALEGLYQALHNAEGSIMPGDHQSHVWQSRRMAIAATHIETAWLFASQAVMEVS